MLDELFKRDDVKRLLEDICNSASYYDKKSSNFMGEQILFLFYDALFKYKIIIDDMTFFDNFLEQVDKLIRKIDNYTDIGNGINKLIGRICSYKLSITDIEDEESKKLVLKYVYDKYIINGYYIHGYSSCYYSDIFTNGFVIEDYNNLYNKFVEVQNILNKKKHGSILEKDFSLKQVEFTDSFLLGCYYSVNSPMFFSKLLCRNEFITNDSARVAYSKNDYNLCLKNLNKLIFQLDLNDNEKAIFMDAFKSEWKLLNKDNSDISLLLIHRNDYKNDNSGFDSFLEENKNLDFMECMCKLLGEKNSIVITNNFSKDNIVLLNLPHYRKFVKEEKKESLTSELEKTFITGDDEFAFSNTYGKVSVLLLIGTMLITIGVILTMIMFS